VRKTLGRLGIVTCLVTALSGAFLAGVVQSPGYAANPACRPDAILVNPCRPWLGASANKYPEVTATLKPQILYHEQRIGRQVDIVHAYNGPGTNLTSDETYFATRPDTLLFLNWRPTLTWADAGGSDPATNASIDAMAQSIKDLGSTKIFLTVFHEPEAAVSGTTAGCTSPGTGTSGTTDDYRAMWQNVRDRFDALGVANVVWVMTYMSYAPYRCMDADLWPGNDLVDWVAFDNYGNGTQPNFVTNVGSMYDFLNSTSDADHDYASKPYALAEWGIRGPNVTPQETYAYSDEAKAAVEGDVFPNLKAYMIFDNSGSDGNENRIAYQNGGVYDPVRQQHYVAFANSSAFVDPVADTTAPTAGITAPDDQASVTGTVSVTAEVGDDHGVTQAQLKVDGAASGDPVADPGGSVGFTLDTSTLGDGPHTLRVQVQDAAGNTGLSDPVTVNVYTPDTTAPTTPGGLKATLTGSTVDLSWQASSDDIGVRGYTVLRNGVALGQTTATTYADTTGRQGTTYTYTVRAYDAAGNTSVSSSPLSQTVPDVTAPTTPAQPTVKLTANKSVTVTWKAVTDNVGVTGYQVSRNGVLLTKAMGLTYTDSSVKQGSSYTYQVSAVDAAGNVSFASPKSKTVTVADTTAPSTPLNPKGSSTNARTVKLSWSASSDNVAVTGYTIYRGSTKLGTVSGSTLTYSATGLTSGRSYTFEIQARDAAGNVSRQSKGVTVKVK
jgi:chitodextrinase